MKSSTGCLIGQALGDALGGPVEFLNLSEIRQRFSPNGPQEPLGNPMRVTDDTQLMLAVAQALSEVDIPVTPGAFEHALRASFVAWRTSPENNRAPGMTCLEACDHLAAGLPWYEATIANSKGSGANMRVAPVGLFSAFHNLDEQTCAALAQFQAALTHGHPTALAAADLTVWIVSELVTRQSTPDTLLNRARVYAQSQRTVYHADWLGPLWQRPYVKSPAGFIEQGWDECLAAVDRVEAAVKRSTLEDDLCTLTGAGWTAEDALATGLVCFLLFPADPIAAIRRAACTSGDSDTIASLTGAFAGAYHGLDVWPAEWIARLEYREQLFSFGSIWDLSP